MAYFLQSNCKVMVVDFAQRRSELSKRFAVVEDIENGERRGL